MNIVLLNGSFTYTTPYLPTTEPLGVLYLASYLRSHLPDKVQILDCVDTNVVEKIAPKTYRYGIDDGKMLSIIKDMNPDIIGITCSFTRKKNDFHRTAKLVKEHFPDAKLVAGGTYPTLFPEEVIKTGIFDYCIVGEGEDSFLQLVNSIKSGLGFEGIDGLVYREGDKILVNKKTTYIQNLDDIPFPARDLINYERGYLTRKSVIHGLGLGRTASILTSRSCPNRCKFCSMFLVHGPKWRSRSPLNVINEIKELKYNYNINEFFILDDNFTLSKDRVLEFCDLLMQSKLKLKWNTPSGVSINTLDKKVLQAMKDAGCANTCIAIESGDEFIRNNVIGKKLSDKKIAEVLKYTSEIGLPVTAFYIIGMPGETEESFQKTLDQLRELPLNGAVCAFANPLPGTELYDDCIKNNYKILHTDEDGSNDFYLPYIETSDFDSATLIEREKRFYRTFIKHKWPTIIRDTLLFRNKLLDPKFFMRMVFHRLLKNH
jgi:anaerobic magnesium-protoporphyrin IX monomethyl ester cyclase